MLEPLPPHTDTKKLPVGCQVCPKYTRCRRGRPRKDVVFDAISRGSMHWFLQHIASPTHLQAEYRWEEGRSGCKGKQAMVKVHPANAIKCPGYGVSDSEELRTSAGKTGYLYQTFLDYSGLYGRIQPPVLGPGSGHFYSHDLAKRVITIKHKECEGSCLRAKGCCQACKKLGYDSNAHRNLRRSAFKLAAAEHFACIDVLPRENGSGPGPNQAILGKQDVAAAIRMACGGEAAGCVGAADQGEGEFLDPPL